MPPAAPAVRNSLLPRELTAAGRCLHLPGACDEPGVYEALLSDVRKAEENLQPHRSGRHLQIFGDALMDSPVFTNVVRHVLDICDQTLVDCWVNIYRHGADCKAMHHDNYWDRKPNPTSTMAVSFGCTRPFAFQHAETGRRYSVPQKNGDVLFFDEDFNKVFRHAIPPTNRAKPRGENFLRLAVIIWGTDDPTVNQVDRKLVKSVAATVPPRVSWNGWPFRSAEELPDGARGRAPVAA